MPKPLFLQKIVFAALLAGTMLFFAPVSEAAIGGKIIICGREYCPFTLLAGRLRMKVRRYGDSRIELYDAQRTLIFFPQKRYFLFNGVKGTLNFAPVVWQGRSCLARLDLEKVLDPLLGNPTRFRRRLNTVVIDPGHGGRDQGAAGNGIIEKNLTLKIAGRVTTLLRQHGFRVVMTRYRDLAVALPQRPQLAGRVDAGLFVSIHVNAVADPSLSGIECFALTPRSGISSNDRKVVNEVYRGDACQPAAVLLAWQMQNSMLRFLKSEDRGMKFARFVVLRECSCPATLVEIGFLSNAAEARRMRTAAFQENTARAIVDGVLRYAAAVNGRAGR